MFADDLLNHLHGIAPNFNIPSYNRWYQSHVQEGMMSGSEGGTHPKS